MIIATTPTANRQRVKQGYGSTFWQEQERLLDHWAYGYLPPKGLAIGELPQINTASAHKPRPRLTDGREHLTITYKRLPEEED